VVTKLPYTENLQAVKQLARSDPKLVASVVKGWVANNG
jgi:flagellar biosynthesis/type III secretory pathway M-ring protein FliF/YscJ